FAPAPTGGGQQLENLATAKDLAVGSAALDASGQRSAVEVPGGVEDERRAGDRSISCSARERIQDGLFPATGNRLQLEKRAAAAGLIVFGETVRTAAPAGLRGSVEVSGRIHHQRRAGMRAIVGIPGEV